MVAIVSDKLATTLIVNPILGGFCTMIEANIITTMIIVKRIIVEEGREVVITTVVEFRSACDKATWGVTIVEDLPWKIFKMIKQIRSNKFICYFFYIKD